MASSSSMVFPALSLSTTASLLSIQNRRFLNTLLFPSHQNKSKPLAVVASKKNYGMGADEDMDDVLDDLFEKYGKVVFRSTDQKPANKETIDDAQSLSFAVALAKVASDVKASEIRLLFVKPLVYWTQFFIIATAFSRPQIDAISTKIRDVAVKQFNRVASGDTTANSWTLLDFGDVVVHIFLPQQREFYNLEEFYGNATSIELPFDSQSSSRT